jgi:hypothetical protein
VLYDDGERAFEVLPAETVKWVLRPRQERTVNGVRLPWLPAAARRRAAVEEAEVTRPCPFHILQRSPARRSCCRVPLFALPYTYVAEVCEQYVAVRVAQLATAQVGLRMSSRCKISPDTSSIGY